MLHRFAIADLTPTPWKNGGGDTREIVCQPPGAGVDGFDWRVSVATIATTGPFSAFPGVDRVIMLLDGVGVHLQGDGVDHRLDTPLAPFAFAGDAALGCSLLGGTSTDFNLMTRRGKLQAELTVLRTAGTLASAPHGLLLALGDGWQLHGATQALQLEAGHGIWWHGQPRAWQATPQTTPQDRAAALVVVRLQDLR